MKYLLTVFITVLFINIGTSQTVEQTPTEFIKTESIGGKLDFKKTLEEEGKANTFHLFDGVAYSSRGYALILWGKAVNRLGISSLKEAAALWESIYASELSKADFKALKKGFKLKS